MSLARLQVNVRMKNDDPGVEPNEDRPRWFENLTRVRAKHRFALRKCQARRWRDSNVLKVDESCWQRQLLWALAKMDLLCSDKRRLAEEAVKVGLYNIMQECPNRHTQHRCSRNGVNFKNKKITDKNYCDGRPVDRSKAWRVNGSKQRTQAAYCARRLSTKFETDSRFLKAGLIHRWKLRWKCSVRLKNRQLNALCTLRKWKDSAAIFADVSTEFSVSFAAHCVSAELFDYAVAPAPATEIYVTEFGQAVIDAIDAAACPAACPVGSPSAEYRLACTFYDANIPGDGPPVWLSLITGWDTMSTVNCIIQSRVPAGAHWITKGGFVTGVGGQKTAAIGTILLPNHKMTYLGAAHNLEVTVVAALPHGVEMLVGMTEINARNIKCDHPGWRVHVRDNGETVRLDLASKVAARQRAGFKTALSMCAGLLVEPAVLLEMGWKLVKVFVVELVELHRQIAEANYGELVHFIGSDVKDDLPDYVYHSCDFSFCGPCCPPWSRLREPAPGGFAEPDAQVFRDCCKHNSRLTSKCHKFLETVVVHKSLKADEKEQERLCGGEINELNALDVGSPASRQRRYYAPSADWDRIMHDMCLHMNPDFAADAGSRFLAFEVPCIVARGAFTKAPVYVFSRGMPNKRFANSDERDRLQGCIAGMSNGGGQIEVTDNERDGINGRAFSADAVWSICRTWQCDVIAPAVLAVIEDYRSYPSSEQMRIYTKMFTQGKDKLDGYLTNIAHDLVMPKLNLASMVAAHNTVSHQTKAPGHVKAGLGPSADYCVDSQIVDKTHIEVQYDPKFWIYLLFFKKKGRTVVAEFDGESYKVGDILEALRPLRNYTPLNAAIAAGLPKWWAQFCPDIEAIRNVFPKAVKWMAVFDCKNAFHRVGLHEDSRMLCVSKYRSAKGRERLIQAIGGDQGVSAMALFYTLWVRSGYNHFFHEAWWKGSTPDPCAAAEPPWWENFQDDAIILSIEEAKLDCEVKLFLMATVSRLMGQEVSPKITLTVCKEVLFTGLIWTLRGITIGETAVNYILDVLLKQPAGIKQARMLRGVIVQARSAFEFTQGEMIRFGQLVAAITAVIDTHTASGVFRWTDAARDAVVELAERLKDLPRAYTDPNLLMSDGYCLCIRGDADPSAIVTSLWLIKRNDANDVCCADFEHEDPNFAILLSIRPKTLNESARQWHISEKELLCMVYGVEKYGKLINEVVARWALTADQSKWQWHCGQLVPQTAKICFASDSSSALGMMLSLQLPSGKVEYLTPKIERITGYAETCACTQHWPVASLQMPGAGNGPTNSLCDFICRTVGELKRMRGVKIAEDTEDTRFVFTEAESYTSGVCLLIGGDESDVAACLNMTTGEPTMWTQTKDCELTSKLTSTVIAAGVPAGMTVKILPFKDTEWQEIIRAYAEDVGEWSAVRLCDVFAYVNDEFTGSSKVQTAIQSWIGKLFFPVSVAGCGKKVLYTPRTVLRPVDGSDGPDLTKELVLVVPEGARVSISSLGLDNDTENLSAEGNVQDLRHDIVWWAHNAKVPHARLHDSLRRAASVSYWKKQEHDVRYQYRYCSVCCALRLSLKRVGLGFEADRPNQVVQMDDAPLGKALMRLPGITYTSVLVLIDVCSGIVSFQLRRSQGAAELAYLLIRGYIKENGIMDILWSDSAPAYLAEATTIVCGMLGVKDRIQNSLGSHSRFVERAIAAVRKALFQAELTGDCMSDRDLELIIDFAQIDVNQVAVTDGSTGFERTRAVKPNTAEDIAAVHVYTAQEINEKVKTMQECDAQMIQAMHARCSALLAERGIQQEKRSRYNFGARLTKEHSREARGAVDHKYACEGIEVGQRVSYQGNAFYLMQEEEVSPGQPIKALIRSCSVENDDRWVMFDQLTALAIDEPHLKLPRSEFPVYEPNDVVAFVHSDDDACVELGLVQSCCDTNVHVQLLEHRRCKTKFTWLPLWSNTKVTRRHTAQPEGFEAVCKEVSMSMILGKVSLTSGHMLDAMSLNLLESLGLSVDVKAH